MDVLLIVLLTLLNAVFAMSEMALASSRKAVLMGLADDRAFGAQAALALQERPTEFLSTIQIGITTLGVLNGIIGEAAFSEGLAESMVTWGVSSGVADGLAIALVVTLITLNTILFGELVPKRIGQIFPETAARLTSPLMLGLSWMARPLVRALSVSTAAVLGLLRIDMAKSRQVTEEEISASLVEGVDAGLIEQHEHQMVKNVFHLDERSLVSLMVPRNDIVWLESDWTIEQALTHIRSQADHSWYPLCKDGLDEVVGMVDMATLFRHVGSPQPLQTWAVPAIFMPETLSGLDLLSQFRKVPSGEMNPGAKRRTPTVLVVDEYGVVQGLVSPRDLLEAITGEWVASTSPSEVWAVQREDGSWLLDGRMPLQELKSRLALDELPMEEKGMYNTVAGLILVLMGELPRESQSVDAMGWRFEVIDLDGRRIDKVLAAPLPVSQG